MFGFQVIDSAIGIPIPVPEGIPNDFILNGKVNPKYLDAVFDIKRSGFYKFSDVRVTPMSAIIEELIGADLTYIVVHVNMSNDYGATLAPPTIDPPTVQIDLETGLLTFAFDLDDDMYIWAEYKKGGSTTPIPSDELFNNGVFSFSTVFDFDKKFNFS